MKLAEALQNRADLQARLAQLRARLVNNATVQEGEQTAESPTELLGQLEAMTGELETLICRINLTNAQASGKDGQTMTALLAKRDCLRNNLSIYREFLNEASQLSMRVRGSEIKIKSAVPVSDLQKTVDQKSQELRRLELNIQEQNWLTELV